MAAIDSKGRRCCYHDELTSIRTLVVIISDRKDEYNGGIENDDRGGELLFSGNSSMYRTDNTKKRTTSVRNLVLLPALLWTGWPQIKGQNRTLFISISFIPSFLHEHDRHELPKSSIRNLLWKANAIRIRSENLVDDQ